MFLHFCCLQLNTYPFLPICLHQQHQVILSSHPQLCCGATKAAPAFSKLRHCVTACHYFIHCLQLPTSHCLAYCLMSHTTYPAHHLLLLNTFTAISPILAVVTFHRGPAVSPTRSSTLQESYELRGLQGPNESTLCSAVEGFGTYNSGFDHPLVSRAHCHWYLSDLVPVSECLSTDLAQASCYLILLHVFGLHTICHSISCFVSLTGDEGFTLIIQEPVAQWNVLIVATLMLWVQVKKGFTLIIYDLFCEFV